MGVKGLHSFLEGSCPSAILKVTLAAMVEEFRKENPDIQEPILVVDGLNCIRKLYGDLDWVCGGQWLQFTVALKNFVQSLQALGLKLVFFFDGITPTFKRAEWFRRRLQDLADVKEIFDLMKCQSAIPDSKFKLPASMGGFVRLALKYVCGVTVYTVLHGDCDQVIAAYAVKNRSIAILANDTDYIVYDTVPLISIEKLNLTTLETVLYDREALCSHLDIPVKLLPVFACLIGNDYISRDSLKPVHSWLNDTYRDLSDKDMNFNSRISHSVARLIRSVNARADPSEVVSRLPKICSAFKRNRSLIDNIKSGLNSYKLSLSLCDLYRNLDESGMSSELATPEGIINFILEQCVHNDMATLMHHVLAFGVYEQSTSLEDESNRLVVPSVIIYQPIRRRLYCLIFNFRDKYLESLKTLSHTGLPPAKDTSVKEWWVSATKKSHIKPDQVRPLPVTVEGSVPNLLQLWTDCSESAEEMKWETIRACLELSQSVKCIKEIPDRFKLLCILLNYLKQSLNIKISSVEFNAFLMQAVLPCAYDTEWLNSLQVRPYEHRAVYLGALFMRGMFEVLNVLTICGRPYPVEYSMPWDCFDGKRFHHCYTKLKSGVTLEALCYNSVEALDLYIVLKLAVLDNLAP